MADDGTGQKVDIPSFLIGFYDGFYSIANYKDQKVIVQAEISLAAKTNKTVHVDLWYSHAYELYNSEWDFDELSTMQSIFGTKVIFHPRLVTLNCPYCTKEEKELWCVHNGNYCPLFPTSFESENLTADTIVG